MAAQPAVGNPAMDRGFFGHPRGLSTLFFTEMWERFSYYGMRALLILFMTATAAEGGLGFDKVKAGAIYGIYTAMVYLLGVPGGWVADRILGQRKAILWGGVVIALGHFSMAVPSIETFYLGLALICIGTGLMKTNVSTLVGGLYSEGDNRRDAGFSIYYMGINLGAFLSPLVCGYVGQRINWHYGFGLAGIGMTLGLVQYVAGTKYLGSAGLAPATLPSDRKYFRIGSIALIAIPLLLLGLGSVVSLSAVDIADGFGVVLLLTVVVTFAAVFAGNWSRVERNRLYVVLCLFIASCFFWSLFEQAGSTLNLFADESTHNNMFGYDFPSSWFQSENSLFLIVLAPVFAWLWVRLGSKEPTVAAKFSFGLLFVGAGFLALVPAAVLSVGGAKVSPWWLTLTYLLHTIGELCLSPVGLSAMTKLAPARIGGLIMGVFFMSISVGNYFGGRLAGFYEAMPLSTLFAAVGAVGMAAGLVLLLFLKPLQRLSGGVR